MLAATPMLATPLRPLLAARAAPVFAVAPPPFSRTLLIGDAGALLLYSLGLSASRTLALAPPDLSAATDLGSLLLESNMRLTVQFVEIEQLSAVVMALGWCVGAALGGGLGVDWFDRAEAAERDTPGLGVMGTLLLSWAYATPLFELGKAVAVAAVILPVGGSLAFDPPTFVADAGGMLLAIALWRTALLRLILPR
jgi:hypothetical protein